MDVLSINRRDFYFSLNTFFSFFFFIRKNINLLLIVKLHMLNTLEGSPMQKFKFLPRYFDLVFNSLKNGR